MLRVESRILPTRNGLAYPARLPTELIHAMPAAAAVAERKPVGRDQKVATVALIPAAAKVSATNPSTPGIPGMADTANAVAPINPAMAMCQRRSPVRSEWRPTATMEIAAILQGIMESSPTWKGSFVMVS